MNEAPEAQPICGIIMPISHTDDLHTEGHWAAVLKFIRTAIERANMLPQPVWTNADHDVIQAKILQNLFENELVVCDVSTKNPNVMLELGMRLTTKRPTVIIAEEGTKLPFDTGIINTLFYDPGLQWHSISDFLDELSALIREKRTAAENGSYHSYLEVFKFETVQPTSVSVTESEAIAGRLDEIMAVLTKAERRASALDRVYSGKVPVNFFETLAEATPSTSLTPNGDARLSAAIRPNPAMATGVRVRHAKFGDGTIAQVEGNKVIIEFDDRRIGERRVIDSFVTII